jgi:hypothetical protein
MPRFNGPTVDVPFPLEGSLVALLPHGLAVLRIDGTWSTFLAPSAAQVAAADRLYEGGRNHTITEDQAAELTGAGFGAYILEDS